MTEILEKPKLVTVFGGSGFLGRHVVRALAQRGYQVRAAVRRSGLAGHLQPLGNIGQIQAVQANLSVRWSVDRAVEGADHVINLVGILFESGQQSFEAVQDLGARAVAEAAKAAGAGLTHGSAIGADAKSPSAYARTKALGEKAVLETMPDAVIFRPSIIFGPEDHFFNRFAGMAKLSPVLPLIGGGHTKFQPVYVGDVAEAIARSVDGKVAGGRIYELGGPDVRTFKQLMQEMLDVIGRKRFLAPVPWPLASLQASILGLLPNPLLTRDQVTLLKTDNVVSKEAEAEGAPLPASASSRRRPRRSCPPTSGPIASPASSPAEKKPERPRQRGCRGGLLPEGLAPWVGVLLVVASAFTSALTASFGVGGGIAMLALMGLFVPVAALIPVHGAVQLGSNTGRAWHQREFVHMDVAGPFIVGSVFGAIAGAFLVVQLPDALLKLVLGGFILVLTWAKIPGIHRLSTRRAACRKQHRRRPQHAGRRDRTAGLGAVRAVLRQ